MAEETSSGFFRLLLATLTLAQSRSELQGTIILGEMTVILLQTFPPADPRLRPTARRGQAGQVNADDTDKTGDSGFRPRFLEKLIPFQ